MWWRFWRRRRRAAASAAAPVAEPPAAACGPRPAQRENDDDDRDVPAAPAFFGASPSPATELDTPRLEQPAAAPGASDPEIVALVRAALARDRAQLQTLTDRRGTAVDGAAAPGLAAPALAALGARLLAAADVTATEASGGGVAAAAALAQADTLSHRAEPLRAAVAPDLPSRLLRDTARFAAGPLIRSSGSTAGDPTGDPTGSTAGAAGGADGRHRLLAAAVLLAQTCLDGQGDPEHLVVELAERGG